MHKKITKSVFDKLFPIGTVLPFVRKHSLPFGVWRLCDGKKGMPNLDDKMNKKVLGRYMMRTE